MATKPARQGNTDWPLTQEGLANLNDTIDDIYRKLTALGTRIDVTDAGLAALGVRVTAIELDYITEAELAAFMLAHAKCATVATAETQASGTAYGDIATAGPAVTVTMTGTVAIVWLSCLARRNGVGNTGFMGVAVSGASTVAASDTQAASAPSDVANHNATLSRVLTITGLTSGDNTFTSKYHNDGGGVNWTFENRGIAVYAP